MADFDQGPPEQTQQHPYHQAVDPALQSANIVEELEHHNAFTKQQHENVHLQHQYGSPPPVPQYHMPNDAVAAVQAAVQNAKQQSTQRPPASRLKKACDHCSERKVKCDNDRPCKACTNLGIPCTEKRQSKRRGPPNKTLQRIQAEQNDDSSASGVGSSPDNAAQALTYLAKQNAAGVVVLGDLEIVTALLDEYFVYVHPLVPIPHEPSFRAMLRGRADLHDPSFVGLVAAMLEVLTAAYPSRVRIPFQNASNGIVNDGNQSFSALDYARHCRSVALRDLPLEAWEKEPSSTNDAMTQYMLGLASMHEGNVLSCRNRLGDCQKILSNGSLPKANDFMEEEQRRRTAWALTLTVNDLQQAGNRSDALVSSVDTLAETADLPSPNDDELITASGPSEIPHDYVSRHWNFYTSVRLHDTFVNLSKLEDQAEVGFIATAVVVQQYEEILVKLDTILADIPWYLTGNFDHPPHQRQLPPGQYALSIGDRVGDYSIGGSSLPGHRAILFGNAVQIKTHLIEKCLQFIQGQSISAARDSNIDHQIVVKGSNGVDSHLYGAEELATKHKKDEITRNLLILIVACLRYDNADAILSLELVAKLKLSIIRLTRNTPGPHGERPVFGSSASAAPDALIVRAGPYLERVANVVLEPIEHFLSVRGDQNGVEAEIQQNWMVLKALSKEYGLDQLIEL